MKKVQEERKSQIQAHVLSQVGEIEDHVNSCIEKNRRCSRCEKRDWKSKGRSSKKIEEVKSEVQRTIEEGKGEVQRMIGFCAIKYFEFIKGNFKIWISF
ncbi:hypothetical protein AVEN_275294-1 [Araneus ventricosus]|uniref:Uncharacterized protein n=1 Tax=Araneus ventricosus TaxID=182803 RepID=A0A4Y2GCI4_ARAVE|nr:hypothetical protein AVEN_275294-1 [Araneus ventricosus]